MLNHSLKRVLCNRPAFKLAVSGSNSTELSAAHDLATRRFTFEKVKIYNKKSKTGAKERRRQRRE